MSVDTDVYLITGYKLSKKEARRISSIIDEDLDLNYQQYLIKTDNLAEDSISFLAETIWASEEYIGGWVRVDEAERKFKHSEEFKSLAIRCNIAGPYGTYIVTSVS